MANNKWNDIAYPWGSTLNSFVQPKDDYAVIKTSLYNIILTSLGEYVMNPQFGSLVPQALFNQNDLVLANSIKSSVRQAIETFEDRVTIKEIVTSQENNTFNFTVVCTYLGDDDNELRIGFSMKDGVINTF